MLELEAVEVVGTNGSLSGRAVLVGPLGGAGSSSGPIVKQLEATNWRSGTYHTLCVKECLNNEFLFAWLWDRHRYMVVGAFIVSL